ncbi:MAG: hypothetical protein HRT47_09390 [Candidatus Caenarcaniphilales bacterium]|nr:hypothetical protein [Candidatus Caenarcaniphilales bacterium]
METQALEAIQKVDLRKKSNLVPNKKPLVKKAQTSKIWQPPPQVKIALINFSPLSLPEVNGQDKDYELSKAERMKFISFTSSLNLNQQQTSKLTPETKKNIAIFANSGITEKHLNTIKHYTTSLNGDRTPLYNFLDSIRKNPQHAKKRVEKLMEVQNKINGFKNIQEDKILNPLKQNYFSEKSNIDQDAFWLSVFKISYLDVHNPDYLKPNVIEALNLIAPKPGELQTYSYIQDIYSHPHNAILERKDENTLIISEKDFENNLKNSLTKNVINNGNTDVTYEIDLKTGKVTEIENLSTDINGNPVDDEVVSSALKIVMDVLGGLPVTRAKGPFIETITESSKSTQYILEEGLKDNQLKALAKVLENNLLEPVYSL